MAIDHRNLWIEIEHAVMLEANRLGLPAEYNDDTLSRRQEKLALIRLLRDQTHSKDVYDRCVAIVGRE